MRLLGLLALCIGSSSALSTAPTAAARVHVSQRRLPLLHVRHGGTVIMVDANDDDELRESDADSADSGPKILMPPTEFLGAMPREADSFAGYLAPYALLVLLAFGLASAAFAFLVLGG